MAVETAEKDSSGEEDALVEMGEELFAEEDDNPFAETIKLIDANTEEIDFEVAECISEVNNMVFRFVKKNLNT